MYANIKNYKLIKKRARVYVYVACKYARKIASKSEDIFFLHPPPIFLSVAYGFLNSSINFMRTYVVDALIHFRVRPPLFC